MWKAALSFLLEKKTKGKVIGYFLSLVGLNDGVMTVVAIWQKLSNPS